MNKKQFHGRPRSHTKGHHHKPSSHHAGPTRPGATSGPKPEVEGILQVKGSFGFVLSENPAVGDVMIQGPSLKLAMDGDRVRARVHSVGVLPATAGGDRRSGVIVQVLRRARDTVVGTFQRRGNQAVVVNEKDQSAVHILDMNKLNPKVNDVAVVRLTRWPTLDQGSAGTLIEVLGSRDTPGVDLAEVVRKFDLPQRFSPGAEAEAVALGEEVPESTYKHAGRQLFFEQRVFTIDGADAKDFDDAVSLEVVEDGWRLGVHIADVAQYVRENTVLDREARERGTSVYFPGSVIPMLPFPLSDGLCSLRPHVIRLTLSCVMDLSREGRVTDYRVVESAIKSCQRFTYEQVEEILKGKSSPGLDPAITTDVQEMGRLARLLREKRFARGSLDFDFPEADVVLGLDGRPIDIKTKGRLEAHRLIEEFMLLANETVARHMQEKPFLYRIHETPDPARVEKLKKSLEALGIRLPQQTDITRPLALKAVLSATEGTPKQSIVHLLVLRSLKQAVYSPVNRGHFGLASECYTHFTSPIRRYPDLTVHRLLKERIHNNHQESRWSVELDALCLHCSKRERIAVEAEREVMDIQKVRLMEPHVGSEFNGVVSSVTNFGFFVQLDQFFVEGLVHVTTLGNDYYVFDEARLTLTGRRSGRVYALGTKVKIRLAAANVLKRQLDFQLLGAEGDRHSPNGHRRLQHSRPHGEHPPGGHPKGHSRHTRRRH